MKVMIAVPTGEMARRADFIDYVMQIDRPENTIMTFAHGRSAAENRNLMAEQALGRDCTHILFIDDDMAPRPDILKKLIAHDKQIISGLYLTRKYPHRPVLFDIFNDNNEALWHELTEDESGVIEVEGCGLGACLINTNVFRILEKPWIRYGETARLDSWCHDIGFFRRARKAGFEVYCDLDCTVGHMGTMTIYPHKTDKWFSIYDTAGEGQVSTPQISSYTLVRK